MKVWRVGLVGTGFWSDKHLKAWKRIPNVVIAGLCNRSRSKLEAKALEYGIAKDCLFDNIEDMLRNGNIDIVDIVTGPETHLEFVEKAAAYGKHIMCQKPFARSLEEAEQMVDTADKAGVRLMVTENWRWLQPFQLIKQTLKTGALGKLNVARYVHTDYYTPRMEPGVEIPQPFFREMPKLLFYEMGVHWFDTWRFLFGTPKRLYAETTRVSPHIQGEDSGIVTLGYDDFYGFMDMSWATRQKLDKPLGHEVGALHLEQMVIDGDNGTLKLFTNGKITLIDKDGLNEKVLAETTELDHEESHFRLQSHFITCLNSGEEFDTSAADNLITLKMAFGTYQSAEEHMPIRIS
ncbi:gfo/Idh/MocA family oxidoreductase [Paenibacillus psychroresistens]|uniref:Gfo/Idh/MocA family oxidoreductase n=1 Tax=Paenibacillus psychroresistens TaxID=1778678 RepID=A0A6B8RGZ1_9BACL|nr:Gfo/Idh/MocA family oxidoreductase [Paenibacillus psychroresistens]QGQ94994.1 gfo/Idh/MocA family oxidoreductase [Paenibacillus psychroresistens]